ncbi:MAG: glycosyltransferase [Solirubrobacterales bacterium]
MRGPAPRAADPVAATIAGAPRAVVVLGPSRSGTSAVTGLLNRLGMEVGAPERLLAASPVNPKGFYEHRELVAVNDALLARLGGAWDRPPRPEPGWPDDPAFADLRERARALIADELAPAGLWGLKDPRLCVTLPFWRELLDEPAFVICHRNPVEVAQSLERRDGMGEAAGLDLWARTMAAALVNTAGARRLFAGYDELFAAPERLLADLADLLGRPEPAEDAAGHWLDGALRHHAADPAQAVLHPGLAGRRSVLHLLLERAVQSRATDPALRGAACDGPLVAALDDVAATVLAAEPGDDDRPRRSPARLGPALGARPAGRRRAGSRARPARLRCRRAGGGGRAAGAGRRCGAHRHAGSCADAVGAGVGARPSAAAGPRRPRPGGSRAPRRAGPRAGGRRRGRAPGPGASAARAAGAGRAGGGPRRPDSHERLRGRRRVRTACRRARGGARRVAAAGGLRGRHRRGGAGHRATAERLPRDPWPGRCPRSARGAGAGRPRAEPCAAARAPRPRGRAARALRARRRGARATARPRPAVAGRPRAHCPNVARPAVSIVVLVHDTPDEVDALVRSIVEHTDDAYELLLVDNGSGPEASAALHDLADEVGARRLRFDDNRHFAEAMNAAITQAVGDELALLNSDTIVTAGWLRNLRAALHSSEDVAMVGPRSNSAHLAQGGIWLDDLSAPGIERFARGFNHPDRRRWFDVDWLVAFAVLARRSALERVGGFDATIRTGDHEDHDLGDRLRAAGYRLLCAGDTFVAHLGQRTYQRAGLNRTALRFGGRAADQALAPGAATRLLRDARGRVFEVADGVASFVETRTTLALIRRGREIEDAGSELDDVAFGPPAYVVRAGDGDGVWIIAGDRRARVTGDPQRIRRLPGLAVIERDDLEARPEDGAVAVEDALPPVPEIEPLLPSNPALIEPAALATAPAVAEAAAAALDAGAGFALVGLCTRDIATLNDGAWPLPGPPPASAGQPTAAQLRAAIVDADALAVPVRRDAFAVAPLLERLLFHYDLYPPLRCSTAAPYELLGFDAETGDELGHAPLLDLLAGRPVAVVGPLGDAALRFGDRVGLDVRLAVELNGIDGVEGALRELAIRRGEFDAVLVGAGSPGRVLCGRIARELGAVAFDLDEALDRLLYVRHPAHGPADVDRRWQWERYLREVAEPPADDPHPLEGRMVREAGTSPVFLIERGRRRWVSSRNMVEFLGGEVAEATRAELDALPDGLPVSVLYERSGALVLALSGRRVPVDLGLPVAAADDLPTDLLGRAERELRWFPGAGDP